MAEEKQLKSVHSSQGKAEKDEVHVQGPIHGEPHPPKVKSDLKSVQSEQRDGEDDEVHVQGPIHGSK